MSQRLHEWYVTGGTASLRYNSTIPEPWHEASPAEPRARREQQRRRSFMKLLIGSAAASGE